MQIDENVLYQMEEERACQDERAYEVYERRRWRRFLQKRRDETKRNDPDEGQCQVLEIPQNG